jgi:putative peptide zinc metalloprotease protein
MPTEVSGELPRLAAEMHIAPFEQGRAGVECFLVETRAGAFLVNQKMRCLLEALVEQSSMSGLRTQLEASLGQRIDEAEVSAAIAGLPRAVFQAGRQVPGKTPFHFSARLLPAPVVQAVATRIRRLYSPATVAVVAALLMLELPWLIQGLAQRVSAGLSPSGVLVLLAGTCLIAMVHELGHAAACAWYGLRPGEIGFGLYLVFPVFYTDVTKTWRLRPSRRAVVDAGGIYFQAILIVLTVPLAHGLGNDRSLFAFVLFNLYLIFHNLNPLFKMDGYWIFSDLAGLPNLHKRTWQVLRRGLGLGRKPDRGFPWGASRRALLLLHAYAFAVVAYAAFAVLALPRWFTAQLKPYPGIALAHLHAIGAAWSDSNYGSLCGETGRLALVSLMPALVAVLLISWVARIVRRLFLHGKVA